MYDKGLIHNKKFTETYQFFLGLNLYINLACLSVCLCPINVKTAEQTGPKFCVGSQVTPRKVKE